MEDRDGEEENDDLESDDDDEGEAVKGQGKAFSKLDGEGSMNICTLPALSCSFLFFSLSYICIYSFGDYLWFICGVEHCAWTLVNPPVLFYPLLFLSFIPRRSLTTTFSTSSLPPPT
jgi:hypothetical protein